jgi:hypothetical protein
MIRREAVQDGERLWESCRTGPTGVCAIALPSTVRHKSFTSWQPPLVSRTRGHPAKLAGNGGMQYLGDQLMSLQELPHEGNGLGGLIEHQVVSSLGDLNALHLRTDVFDLL